MKTSILLIGLLAIASLCSAADVLVELPSGVIRAQNRYLSALESAREAYQSAMEREIDRATRSGDEEVAQAIRALLARDAQPPAAAANPAPARPFLEPTQVTIDASIRGIPLGVLSVGDQVVIQFISGSWTAYPQWERETPDAAVNHFHRLALVFTNADQVWERIPLPTGTRSRAKAYTVTSEADYFLGIADDVLSGNDGEVIYRIQIIPARR